MALHRMIEGPVLRPGAYGRCGAKECKEPPDVFVTTQFQDRRGRWKKRWFIRCRKHAEEFVTKGK